MLFDRQSMGTITGTMVMPRPAPPDRTDSSPTVAYFPRATSCATWKPSQTVPTQPRTVAVVHKEEADKPLGPFDEKAHQVNYQTQQGLAEGLPNPPKPPGFRDRYLFPSLTRNERVRLTMLWYYTRGLTEDGNLLSRLQDKLNITREFMGWDLGTIGILDNDVFTRIVTAGVPVVATPRRESTCSHTINQTPGSVFMLTNMADDWRFKHAPHVEVGGLRSYAGTQLRCKTEGGQEVALGSLCMASGSMMEPLTAEQQETFVKFADMITAEIVTTSQINRQRQRRIIGDAILQIQGEATAENVEDLVSCIVREEYPAAYVSFQDSGDNSIAMYNRAPVPYDEFQDGLWEDTNYIDTAIASMNHMRLRSEQTTRAIAYQCTSMPIARYLVVASNEIQHVFDDIDTWFIERCSLLVNSLFQERSIKEAIEIKDRFFRGITHQLRTPLHGILGSCELLAEELVPTNDDSAINSKSQAVVSQAPDLAHLSSYISTIKSSGEELMSTINNMLKINRWSEMNQASTTKSLYSLHQLETDLCDELLQLVPESGLTHITIFIRNEVTAEKNLIWTRVTLLKECLQSLLVNAVQYTTSGSVGVVMSADQKSSRLRFDVQDDGCGIKAEDRQRIFKPYEKANEYSLGAGLGLTLASKIANAMNGTISLVSSKEGEGSCFRAEFNDVRFACASGAAALSPQLHCLPKRFHEVKSLGARSAACQHFRSHLELRGFQLCEDQSQSLGVIDYSPDREKFEKLLDNVDPGWNAVCLVPADAAHGSVKEARSNVHFFTGPFTSSRLDDILEQVDKLYEVQSLEAKPTSPLPLEVPLRLLDKSPAKPFEAPEKGSPLRGLLVDDNPINLRIMRMYCEKRHISFVVAVDGQEAVDRYRTSTNGNYPSLILMDLQMPKMDGAQACEEIRKIEAENSLSRAVIFIVSGQDSPADKARCSIAGADDFLVKPVKFKTLDLRVRGYFVGFEE